MYPYLEWLAIATSHGNGIGFTLHSTSRGRSRVLSSDHLPIQPTHSGLRLDVLASRGWSRWDWGHGRHIGDSATSQKLWVCGETTSISENWRENFHIWRFPKMRVSPNHPIFVGFSIINYPFWVPPFMKTPRAQNSLNHETVPAGSHGQGVGARLATRRAAWGYALPSWPGRHPPPYGLRTRHGSSTCAFLFTNKSITL